MKLEKNENELAVLGFEKFQEAIDLNLISRLNQEIENSYIIAKSIQEQNGLSAVTDGSLHHLLAYNKKVYIDLLSAICKPSIYDYIKAFFEGNFIINSYGGVKNLPSKPSYVAKIHRDIRFFSGEFPLMLNLLIMLDDFTLDNGATYLLSGSHLKPEQPEEDEFYKNAARAVGKKGDILFFNSNLWHAAGLNKTTDERRAITITFTKPFMKQQFDYPRCIGFEKIQEFPIDLQQIIGYFSRTPTNLNEWYQKPENRFYRPNQDK